MRCVARSETGVSTESEMGRIHRVLRISVDDGTLKLRLVVLICGRRHAYGRKCLDVLSRFIGDSIALRGRRCRRSAHTPEFMHGGPVQRSGASSGSIFLPFLSDDDTEFLLESTFAQMYHERTDKDSGSYHDQDKKHDLLKGVDDAEVD